MEAIKYNKTYSTELFLNGNYKCSDILWPNHAIINSFIQELIYNFLHMSEWDKFQGSWQKDPTSCKLLVARQQRWHRSCSR